VNPERIRHAQARMRQAYTEACVAWPRLNVTPIQLALYQTYQDVAYFIGTTYVLMDPAIGGEILKMTSQAQQELLAKKDTERLLVNVAQVEHAKYRSMLSGLDSGAGYILFGMLRDGATMLRVKATRTTMLQNRRNILANELTLKAITTANERFKNFPHGEEVVQSRPVDAES
jgi:hypothetical protein